MVVTLECGSRSTGRELTQTQVFILMYFWMYVFLWCAGSNIIWVDWNLAKWIGTPSIPGQKVWMRQWGRERELLCDHSVFFSIIDWPQLNSSATGLDWLVIRKHSAGHSFLTWPHVVQLRQMAPLSVQTFLRITSLSGSYFARRVREFVLSQAWLLVAFTDEVLRLSTTSLGDWMTNVRGAHMRPTWCWTTRLRRRGWRVWGDLKPFETTWYVRF